MVDWSTTKCALSTRRGRRSDSPGAGSSGHFGLHRPFHWGEPPDSGWTVASYSPISSLAKSKAKHLNVTPAFQIAGGSQVSFDNPVTEKSLAPVPVICACTEDVRALNEGAAPADAADVVEDPPAVVVVAAVEPDPQALVTAPINKRTRTAPTALPFSCIVTPRW